MRHQWYAIQGSVIQAFWEIIHGNRTKTHAFACCHRYSLVNKKGINTIRLAYYNLSTFIRLNYKIWALLGCSYVYMYVLTDYR